MNIQNIKNQQTNSVILNLEQLSKEYSNTLIKYNQAQIDYANYIKNPIGNQLKELKGTAFWGTSGIKQGVATNINQCKAMCSSNSKCTGATFNPDKKYCWTRGGEGPVVPSLPNDYALIPEKINLLSQVKIYNQRLLDINQKITSVINNNISLYKNQANNRTINNSRLNKNYLLLTAERNKIQQEINNYESLDKKQNENANKINSNYWWYFIFMGIGCILIFILLKLTEYGNALLETTGQVIDVTKNVVEDAGNQVLEAGKAAVDNGKEMAINAGQAVADAGNEIKDAAANAGDAIVNAGKEAADAGNALINNTKQAIAGEEPAQAKTEV